VGREGGLSDAEASALQEAVESSSLIASPLPIPESGSDLSDSA
jgi:hypothetical protein